MLEGTSMEDVLLNKIKEIKDSIDMLDGNPVSTMGLIIELSEAEMDLEHHRETMHPGFYFVGDNVDMRTKVRHMTLQNQCKDHHMYQICAYENRVSGNHLDNSKPKEDVQTVPFSTFVPGIAEKEKMVSDMAFLVAWQWALHIPYFNIFRTVLKSQIEHPYMKETGQKCKRVNMGVLMKSEQYNEDMTDICEFMHKYIPGHDTTDDWTKHPQKILSGGDYLTFERHKTAQSSKRNGRTPSRRLEGLIPKMEEFHNQGELLTVIWKLLYSTASAPDQGTLYAARNTLNSKNVTKDPHDDFYASSDLVEKITIAYIVTGGLAYFSMNNLDSKPSHNAYNGTIGDPKEMSEYLLVHAKRFVNEFTSFDVNRLPDYGPQCNTLKCRYCDKAYKQAKALRKHEDTIHGHYDPSFTSESIDPTNQGTSTGDRVLSYTKLCLTLGLLRLNHNDAIHLGDGERIMRINHYLYLYYKACHCTKYAVGILETLAQTKALLTERNAHRLVWNRTVNHKGGVNSNLPNDLDVEHCNKVFKEEAHCYRGTFTEKTVSRVSRSALTHDSIVKQFDRTCNVSTASGKHTAADLESDIITLVNQFHPLQLFENIPTRSHRAFPDISENPLNRLNMENIRDWVSSSLKKFNQKHFY